MTGVSLSATIILAALLFGAVYSWAMAIVAFLAVLTFIYFLWNTKDRSDEFAEGRGIILAALLLLSYPLLQLVPLPVSMLNLIHPRFAELVTVSPNAPPLFHSISVYPFATEVELSRLFVYLSVFIVAAFGLTGRRDVRRVMMTLVVFGFVLGVFAIIQHATWNGKIYWFQKPLEEGAASFGPFVNRNHFAGFIGMLIPLSLGTALASRRVERKVIFGFMGIAMAVALFFSLSRGGIVSFVAGLLVFSVLVFTKGMSRKKLIPVLLFGIILAAYLLFLGVSPMVERFVQGEVSTQQRFVTWQGTLAAFRDYPVLGSGFGTFQYVFKIYQPDGLYGYMDHAHNDYLELLLDLGVVGMISVCVFLFVALKLIITNEWEGKQLYLSAAVLASITSIAVHSLVDFNLHIPSNALLFFLVLGLGVALSRGNVNEHQERTRELV